MALFGGMPFPVQFFLAFVIVLGLIGATAWAVRRFGAGALGGPNTRGRQPQSTTRQAALPRSSNAPFRRAIIYTAAETAVLSVIAIVIGFGIIGLNFSKIAALQTGRPDEYEVLGFLIGGFVRFVIAARMYAVFFLMMEIAENTRQTVAFFERMSSSRQA
jgi:hypothetical protein